MALHPLAKRLSLVCIPLAVGLHRCQYRFVWRVQNEMQMGWGPKCLHGLNGRWPIVLLTVGDICLLYKHRAMSYHMRSHWLIDGRPFFFFIHLYGVARREGPTIDQPGLVGHMRDCLKIVEWVVHLCVLVTPCGIPGRGWKCAHSMTSGCSLLSFCSDHIYVSSLNTNLVQFKTVHPSFDCLSQKHVIITCTSCVNHL